MRRTCLRITVETLKKLANLPEDVEINHVEMDYTWEDNPDICFHFIGNNILPQERLANQEVSTENMQTIENLFEVIWKENSDFISQQRQQVDFVPIDDPPRIGVGHDWSTEGF